MKDLTKKVTLYFKDAEGKQYSAQFVHAEYFNQINKDRESWVGRASRLKSKVNELEHRIEAMCRDLLRADIKKNDDI